MTTRLLDCPLVIQHSHEEWPVLDDLLYLLMTLISIAMLRYLLMTYGIVASTFFLFRWCCRYVDGRHSKRLPLRWIFSSLDPSWQVAHSFFSGKSSIYRHEFPLEPFVYRRFLSLPCLITEERTHSWIPRRCSFASVRHRAQVFEDLTVIYWGPDPARYGLVFRCSLMFSVFCNVFVEAMF